MNPTHRRFWVQLSLVLVVALGACRGAPTPEAATATNRPAQPSNTPAEPAEPTADLSILYEDDFSDADSGWPVVTVEGGLASYQNPEVYRLQISAPGTLVPASRSGAFADFSAEVVADFTGGAGDWHAGLIFRQVTPDNYYAFVVNANRQVWRVLKRSLGVWELLAEGISGDIDNAAGAKNTLRVDAGGASLTLSVNGTGVVALTDESFAAGDIGFIAETVDESSVVMNADSVVVRRFDAAAVPPAPTAVPIIPTETPTPTETATPTATTARSPVPPTANLLTALPNSATSLAATAQSGLLTAAALASQIPPIGTLACGLPGLPACP